MRSDGRVLVMRLSRRDGLTEGRECVLLCTLVDAVVTRGGIDGRIGP